ncbi:hypothetical protein GCM10020331_061840 [Ectobacillus funiculus]
MMIEAKGHSLRVPDDIAIIGFDDQPLAEMLDPKLTTIRQPVDQMGGKKSVEVIIEMLHNPEMKTETYEMSIELVVREST